MEIPAYIDFEKMIIDIAAELAVISSLLQEHELNLRKILQTSGCLRYFKRQEHEEAGRYCLNDWLEIFLSSNVEDFSVLDSSVSVSEPVETVYELGLMALRLAGIQQHYIEILTSAADEPDFYDDTLKLIGAELTAKGLPKDTIDLLRTALLRSQQDRPGLSQLSRRYKEKEVQSGIALHEVEQVIKRHENSNLSEAVRKEVLIACIENTDSIAKAARRGNNKGRWVQGCIYDYGIGVEKNPKEAARLFRLAADAGEASARVKLGCLYLNQEGVEKNYKEAASLFRLAADAGGVNAQTNLGRMLQNGEGVEKNYEEAARLYRSAAEAGNTFAQVNLGSMYRQGQGVEKNQEKAIKLYQLAAEAGDVLAKKRLESMSDKEFCKL